MPQQRKRTWRRERARPKSHRLRAMIGGTLLSLALFYLFILKDLPSPSRLSSPDLFPASTQILDRNGQLLYDIYVEKNRTPVKLTDLPEYVKWATLAAEDKDFYAHAGFDLRGISRAVFNTVFRRKLQGGSTISQQLVKNTLLGPERTARRKIREALLTVTLEVMYSKDQIVEMYLNQIPYGSTAYGINAASQRYFNKKATELTLAEAALLAGLPASPTRYSPFGAQPELAEQRQSHVLDQMVEMGKLSPEQAQEAKQQELAFAALGYGIQAPHFVMWIKDQLVERYGEQRVESGGLKVITTLDAEIQKMAQEAVVSEVEKLAKERVSNGAALVTNPRTGEILAMVGSKDYFAQDIDGNVNVTTALRQPGSAIKPLNYALAFDRRILTPASLIIDIPACFNVQGQPSYCPDNYDQQFHGAVQARFALGNSYNLPAVKTLAYNGLETFVASASAMGLTSLKDPKNYGLSLTLGGGEVRMTEMATAFSTLANQGRPQRLTGILKVSDQAGQVLEEYQYQEGPALLSPEAAYLVTHILLDNNARQPTFGLSSYLVVRGHPEVAVKTGTTNDKRDNWTIGYTPSVLVAVWVGNNDNTPMSTVASGVTGASPIWNKIMRAVLLKRDEREGQNYQEWPVTPEGITGASVCPISGLLPRDTDCQPRYEYFITGTLPNDRESLRRTILINKENGQPVQPGQDLPPELVEPQEHPAVVDLSGSVLCLDCPFPTDPAIFNPQELKK